MNQAAVEGNIGGLTTGENVFHETMESYYAAKSKLGDTAGGPGYLPAHTKSEKLTANVSKVTYNQDSKIGKCSVSNNTTRAILPIPGKELQDELRQYDYWARFYDRLSEGTDYLSPFNYAMNNPILMIDSGMAAGTTKGINLLGIVVRPNMVKVMQPVTGLWNSIYYGVFPRQTVMPSLTIEVNNNGYDSPFPVVKMTSL